MEWWAYLRLIKFISVGLLGAGCIGAIASRTQERRLFFAYWVSSFALLGIWSSGYIMMKLTNHKLSESWIALALLLGFVCFHMAVTFAQKPTAHWISGGLSVGAYLGSIAVMVMRYSGSVALWGSLLVTFAAGVAASRWMITEVEAATAEANRETTWQWFRAIARLEGLSLLLMFGISMPVRIIWGVRIDQGTGLIGWVHGVLVLLYLQALLSARRDLHWSGKRIMWGFVASLLPFGTFYFERIEGARLEATTG